MMQWITATGSRDLIEAAWDALAWADPSPADAVDCKAERRGLWRLDAYAADAAAASACLNVIAETAPDLAARTQPLPDIDWVKLSLDGLPPVVAGRFIVAGEHAMATGAPGKCRIRIEAGPAFGTGHHGTTLGCLLALDRLARRGRLGRVLDLGTGSGVLALAAMQAGATRIIASDIDPGSVETARRNAAANRAGRSVRFVCANGARDPGLRRAGPYDTIFANILARPLIKLAPDIAGLTTPGGHLILSGLLTHQEPLVRKAYAARGLALVARTHHDGWSTLTLRKPGAGAGFQCARPAHGRPEARAFTRHKAR
jgi:ribosomal protein L11 methyltransferase